MDERLKTIMMKAVAMSMIEKASDGDQEQMLQLLRDKGEEAIGKAALQVAGQAADLSQQSEMEIEILVGSAVLIIREAMTRGLAMHDVNHPDVTEEVLARFIENTKEHVNKSINLQLNEGETYMNAARQARKAIEGDADEASCDCGACVARRERENAEG